MKQTAEKSDLRRVLRRLVASLVLAMLFVAVSIWHSTGLDVTHTDLPVANLPSALDGLRIAQITDLHSSQYGEGQVGLVDPIRAFQPDIIVLTGDFIDGNRPLTQPCVELARALVQIAPVYRVRGNHEYYQGFAATAEFDRTMAACGVRLLDNSSAVLSKGGSEYLLSGMDDVLRRGGDLAAVSDRDLAEYRTASDFENQILASRPSGSFPLRIMLCHRPYYRDLWQRDGYQVALSGHLHGLQVRLPMIGGVPLMANRYFPDADAGLYVRGDLALYPSRGLDTRSALHGIRLNNQPELALLTITRK